MTNDAFACQCGCGENKADRKIVAMLADVERVLGRPLVVTSGYRCPKHNAEVGGVAGSAHTLGLAADLSCVGDRERFKLVNALLSCGFVRIGIGKTYVHADVSDVHPQKVLWLY